MDSSVRVQVQPSPNNKVLSKLERYQRVMMGRLNGTHSEFIRVLRESKFRMIHEEVKQNEASIQFIRIDC